MSYALKCYAYSPMYLNLEGLATFGQSANSNQGVGKLIGGTSFIACVLAVVSHLLRKVALSVEDSGAFASRPLNMIAQRGSPCHKGKMPDAYKRGGYRMATTAIGGSVAAVS